MSGSALLPRCLAVEHRQPGACCRGPTAVAYITARYADKPEPGAKARYSPRIVKLWAACTKKEKKTGDPCMDFDIWVNAQDWESRKISRSSLSRATPRRRGYSRARRFRQPRGHQLQTHQGQEGLDGGRHLDRLRDAFRRAQGQALHVREPIRKAAGLVAIVALDLRRRAERTALLETQSAVAYVQSIYADHESPGGTARYTPRMQKLSDSAFASPRRTAIPAWTFR